MSEHLKFPDSKPPEPIDGSAGLKTQLPGAAATVGALAAATGGIRPGGMAETARG